MIRVGVLGFGYWGPKLVRNFRELDDCRVVSIGDVNPSTRAVAARRYPEIEATVDCRDVLANPRIDAIAIAAPVPTHYELTMDALRNGKHVLVAKPLATSSGQARELVAEAARRKLVLMVDHTFVYSGAVQKFGELMSAGKLGDVYSFDSVRLNPGLFKDDVSVIWDLAVHDLSILDYVFAARPVAVSATGISHVAGRPENVAYLTLFFADRLIAHIHVSWFAPAKLRRMLICGSERMVVYDDLEPSEKIKVYDRGLDSNGSAALGSNGSFGDRAGDVWTPKLDATEPLRTELAHFLRCIAHGERPISDGDAGLRVVRVLEAATRSMAARGRPVELAHDGGSNGSRSPQGGR